MNFQSCRQFITIKFNTFSILSRTLVHQTTAAPENLNPPLYHLNIIHYTRKRRITQKVYQYLYVAFRIQRQHRRRAPGAGGGGGRSLCRTLQTVSRRLFTYTPLQECHFCLFRFENLKLWLDILHDTTSGPYLVWLEYMSLSYYQCQLKLKNLKF